MLQHWLDLEKELYKSFYVIAIHTSLRPYKLAYLLNIALGTQLKRSKEDLDLKQQETDLYFPLFEYYKLNYLHQYDLIGNRNIQVGKTDGIIHYEEIDGVGYQIGYLIPEYKNVDYFLKVDFGGDNQTLTECLHRINKIKGVQSVYLINNTLIKSINNLIFD